MENNNEFLDDLFESIENLPCEKRVQALEECFAVALNLMDRETILKMRGRVVDRIWGEPELQSVVNLIDGHLALLDLHRTWRR